MMSGDTSRWTDSRDGFIKVKLLMGSHLEATLSEVHVYLV